MENAQPAEGLYYLEQALTYLPGDSILETDLASAYAELRVDDAAEEHFRRALLLGPADGDAYYNFGKWLMTKGRLREAMVEFQAAIVHNHDSLQPRYALMQAYLDSGLQPEAKALAADTLHVAPGDPITLRFLNGQARAQALPNPVNAAEAEVKQATTVEHLLDLSMTYGQAGRYRDCILTAERALKIRPDLPQAYNNIAAAHIELGEWDAAIAAAREALRLKPDFQPARNNLAKAEAQKKLAAGKNQ